MDQLEKLAIVNNNYKLKKIWKASLIFAILNLLLIVLWAYMLLNDASFGSFMRVSVIISLILQIIILYGVYKFKEWVTVWLWFNFLLFIMSINFFAPILNIITLILYKIFISRLKRNTKNIEPKLANKKSKKFLKIFFWIISAIIVLIILANIGLHLFTDIFGESYLNVRKNYKLVEVGDNSFTEESLNNFFTGEGTKALMKYGTPIIKTAPTNKGRVFFAEYDFNHNKSLVTIAINNTSKIYQFSDSYIRPEPYIATMDAGVGIFNANGISITSCWGGWTRGSSFCDWLSEQSREAIDNTTEVKEVWRAYLNKHGFSEGVVTIQGGYPF